MKKLKFLLLVITMCLTIASFSQEKNDTTTDPSTILQSFVKIIMDETNGYISNDISDSIAYRIITKVPDFYDAELIISTINVAIKQYSDIKSETSWSGASYIQARYNVAGLMVMVGFQQKQHNIIFTMLKTKNY